MNKNARMWLIGIAVALIVILLIAGIRGMGKNGTPEPSPSLPSVSESPLSSDSTKAEAGRTSGDKAPDHQTAQNNGTMGTDPLNRYLTEQDSIMMTMKEQMIIRDRSGSAAIDFLKGMIPHHQAAIKMSESYLNHNGASEELKTLAKDIITAQKDEIKQMNDMIGEYEKNEPKDNANEDAYLEKYSEMFSDDSMSHHINPDGAENLDQAFAEGMMMHHQMAVDMSGDILEYTDQKEVRKLAEDIIELQEKEMKLMKKYIPEASATVQ